MNLNLEGIRAVVFGKGPTFKHREKQPGELFVGLNQTVNHQHCDVLVMNDYRLCQLVMPHALASLQLVIIPYWPHVNGLPSPEHPWHRAVAELGWEGHTWVYNLKSSKPEPGYPALDAFYTGAETAVEWLCRHGCRHIQTHGIGVGTGYHPLFEAEYHQPRWDVPQQVNNIDANLRKLAGKYGAVCTLR